jgi:putative tricarboxylic transport membrane protein
VDKRALVGGAVLAGVGAMFVWASRDLPYGVLRVPGSGFFPFWTGAVLAAMGTLTAIAALRETPPVQQEFEPAGPAALAVAMIVFVAALEFVGFVLASICLMFVGNALIERRLTRRGVSFAFAMALGTYALFGLALRLQLPIGRIWAV